MNCWKKKKIPTSQSSFHNSYGVYLRIVPVALRNMLELLWLHAKDYIIYAVHRCVTLINSTLIFPARISDSSSLYINFPSCTLNGTYSSCAIPLPTLSKISKSVTTVWSPFSTTSKTYGHRITSYSALFCQNYWHKMRATIYKINFYLTMFTFILGELK